ncbi:MAG: protein kinase [Anaerolineae bacterium]|nr:protein kinase [Anaerolineae bacterium]
MNLCPSCGRENRPAARFCELCGTALDVPDLPRAGAGPPAGQEGPDDSWSPLRPGDTLRNGAYRILGPLGQGGMGALYLVADTGAFGRKAVVKELLGYYDPTNPEEARAAQARFETEARLLAALSHPGIPRIYSYFSEAGGPKYLSGRHFIVMEYIEGETLEEAVTHVDVQGRVAAARPLPSEEIVRHAVRVCRVLEYLAGQPTPVVHHDIKPANLIVDRVSGEARLVDFGTAKMQTRWARQQRRALGAQRGQTTLFGTTGYAAPEQYEGHSEPRSDVYALAATVYHLLTDDDPADHPARFPALAMLPGPLADALQGGLHPRVERRSTARELRHALEAWLAPEEGGQPFVFRSGAAAPTTRELVDLSDRHWDEARSHLTTGAFEHWFRTRNRHDLVATVQAAQRESGGDADAALEALLCRLDPRRPPPRLVVEPLALTLGHVAAGRNAVRRLAVRNEGQGYCQAQCAASVPWLYVSPSMVGCRPGEEESVLVRVDGAALPLRREHQAMVTCTPVRGARVSIPVVVHLAVVREMLRRLLGSVLPFARMTGGGIRLGTQQWMAAVRSLLRSRLGAWIMVVETLVLAGVLVVFWWTWQVPIAAAQGQWTDHLARLSIGQWLWSYLQALPIALALVYLSPLLVFVLAAVVRSVMAGEQCQPEGHQGRRARRPSRKQRTRR